MSNIYETKLIYVCGNSVPWNEA